MNHISFGSSLREARVNRGYDLETVARRLRIRTDILRAIEEGDFSKMPPRGYTRNMINAYARFLNINGNEITRRYLDEEYAYQISKTHDAFAQRRYDQQNTSAYTSRTTGPTRNLSGYNAARDSGAPVYGTSTSRGRINGGAATNGRTMVEHDEVDFNTYSSRAARPGRGQRANDAVNTHAQVHRARRSAAPGSQYYSVYSSNNYSQGRGNGVLDFLRGKLPFILGGIVVVLIVAIILNLTVCAAPQEEESIPVTGVESTDGEEQATETAPTTFTINYEIAEGSSTYIEIYVDDSCKEASTVEGPASGEYSSSGTIKFVCTETDGVTLKVDGVEQTLEANSNGVCSLTFDFEDILDQWYDDHPDVERPSSDSSSDSSSSDSSSSSSSDSSSTSD